MAIELLEAKSPAGYIGKVDSMLAQMDALTEKQIVEALGVLADVRRGVIEELTSIAPANAQSFQAFQLQALKDAIDVAANKLLADMKPIAGGAIDAAWNWGDNLQPNAFKASGLLQGIVMRAIPTLQLVVAQEIVADLITAVSDDFRGDAKGILTRAILGEKSVHATMKEIAELLRTQPGREDGKLGKVAYQAERIVRTEMMGTANIANQMRHNQIVAENPGLLKIWKNAGDGRVRDSHQVAGNRYGRGGSPGPIPADEPFIVNGYSCQMPHDPNLPARERINCRCIKLLWSNDWFPDKKWKPEKEA